jgi:membrane protease YdiL (CAAX protease family)
MPFNAIAKPTGLIVLSLAAILILYFAIEQITDLFYDADLNLLAVLSNASLAFFMYFGVRWFNKKFNGLSIHDYGFGSARLIRNFLLGISIAGIILFLTRYAAYLIGDIQIDYVGLTDGFDLFDFLMFTLVVGCWEEMYFRGLVVNTLLKNNLSFTATAISSSVLFALLHVFSYDDLSVLSPFLMLGIVFVSIIMTLLYVLTRSIWTSIGLHFFWDFLCMFEEPEDGFSLFRIKDYKANMVFIDNTCIVITGIVLMLFLIIMRKRISIAVQQYCADIRSPMGGS